MTISGRLLPFIASFVLIATGISSHVASAETLGQSLRRATLAHIERMKAAREIAEERLNLSSIRSAAQIRRSEEALIRQIEMLERVREHVSDKIKEVGAAALAVDTETSQELYAALKEIDSQLAGARTQVSRLAALREEAESAKSCDCPKKEAGSWNGPCEKGSPSLDSELKSWMTPPPPPYRGPDPMVAPALPRPS